MTNETKRGGFDGSNIVIEPNHYILGSSALPQTVLQPDGNWLPYMPAFEPQSNDSYDTDGCTVRGTLNSLESLMKRVFAGLSPDYAERYTYILSGVRPPGGDPHKVAEIIRAKGVVDNSLLPMTPTFDAYILPDPMTNDLLLKGTEWLRDKSFGHEWVFTNNPDKIARVALLKQALQYSPVCISVTAWYQDDDGLYIDNGQPNCHWVECVNLELQPNGEYCPIIFDSYANSDNSTSIKKLHPDHHIEFSKRYSLISVTPTVTPEKKTTWLSILKSVLQSLGLIQKEVQALPQQPAPAPEKAVVAIKADMPPIPPTPKYLWDTVDNARHSARVIGDEEGISIFGKDTVCATIMGESGFNNKAINYNKGTDGKTLSTDWGICQINDAYHIGQGKDFPSVAYVLGNPDVAVRFMIRMYKAGKLNLWVAYSSGAYRKYM